MTTAREKVLVFEDLDIDWERLRKALNEAGFEVERAKSPEEFYRYEPYRGFSLILVDIYLGNWPDAEEVGIQMTRKVKEINSKIPVLVVSEQVRRPSIVAEAFRAGACDYMDKQEFLDDVQLAVERVKSVLTSREGGEEQEFPLPMAFVLRDLMHSRTSAKRSVERMVELFEVTLKLVTYSLISSHGSKLKSLLSQRLRSELMRPSLGHFVQVLNALPEPKGFLVPLSQVTKNKRFRSLCENFITLRNNYIGHGVTQTEPVYERLISEHNDKMTELLGLLKYFRQWRLVWPSRPDAEYDEFVYNEAKVFRGSNPEPTFTSLRTRLLINPTDHVHLVNEELTESWDLYPWCQYLVCEKCLNRKLFLYRLAREGEIWALDHIYGHELQTRKGWPEVKAIISEPN